MTLLLRIDKLSLENFRCFDNLDVSFEADLTVFFAENGGGKTAVLNALAMSLDLLQPRHTKALVLNAERDVRHTINKDGQREPALGPCKIACAAAIAGLEDVSWSDTISATARKHKTTLGEVSDAIEMARVPGVRWPLLGFYGTGRFANERKPGRKPQAFQDRWDGYAACLEPSATDGPLLDWLKGEVLGDLVRHRRGESERRFDRGVLDAIMRATPDLADLWYDPALDGPIARFADGSEATWSELSDGYHVFMGLVGDIARRAVILNSQDGAKAPLLVEGVVLVDEVDLHLHPRWQRTVLHGLRAAFPMLQFIITTHSPQVLSSIENRQVRHLVDRGLRERGVFVEGRDSNAILRELMDTDDRDESGKQPLRELYALIDDGRVEEARELMKVIRSRWGDLDPELIRAQGLLDEHAADGDA